LFQSDRVQFQPIFWQRSDGTGQAEQITITAGSGRFQRPTSWAPHSSMFLMSLRSSGQDVRDLSVFTLMDKKATPFVTAPKSQEQGYFSPDGKWVVYQSDEGTRMDLYVEPYPKSTTKIQITHDGGQFPVWSPDSKEVIFVSGGILYSLEIQTKPSLTFSNPVKLAVSGFVQDETADAMRNYDIMPDGKQFVMILPADNSTKDAGPPPEIRGVLNWISK